MLQRLKDLLAGGAGDDRPSAAGGSHEVSPEVAVAALLLESACADDHVHLLENAVLAHGLKQQFGLDPASIEDVLQRAEHARRDSVSLHTFTSVVMREYDERQRLGIVELIWLVILADGELTADESILARQLGNLLDLRPEDVAGAIRRARGK